LQTNILAWINRAGDSEAVAICPLWISTAEDLLRMSLSRLMITPAETVDDAYTIDSEYNDLPTGFIRMRSIRMATLPPKELDYIAPNAVDRFRLQTGSSSEPNFYTLQGNKLRVIPAPATAYTSTITWYGLPSLSNTTTTNWLLDAYPTVYMKAAIAMAHDYYGSEDKKQAALADVDGMLSAIEKTQGQGAAAGSLRQRIDSGCP
jgi:hypothetical protein